ncbi:YgiT-type zinc finger protein [candidate division KSB1 bacterium]|nr:MAG: YgiT-type zinc finger protein [candidate division KSB1 bacterium]MBC6948475.1 YgiT-type zinc finger protein [candidate division KSB1 bacterium]MCE7944512.1 YgiT-type zinc finger protein [Chlorobi bacterium CHB1]MDL1876537.1 YgiT-type zinc finger protein [Cytophagia bacterium CHB2]
MLLKITTCPTCGSNKIKMVKRNWTGNFQGRAYIVPALEFYKCPNCSEEVYDRDAMRKIESYSPAYAKARKRRKAA